jgi:uncharacterized protein (DUF362 family)
VLGGSAGIAATSLLGKALCADEPKKRRVVIVHNPGVIVSGKVNTDVAEKMLNRAVCSLTGKSSSTDAWRSLFSAGEKVVIKVNTLFPPVTSNPEVVRAIANGLKDAGLKENNIIVHDRGNSELVRARFSINDSSRGVRCRGTRAHSGWMEAAPGLFRTKLCKIITDDADAIINVPSLKTHWRSGVTLSLKNLLGCIPNAGDTHGGGCPRIADVSALSPVRKKTRLIVIDGVRAQYDRGPGFSAPFVWQYAGLIVSTDSVAADAVGADEILKRRRAAGLSGPLRPSLIHITRAAELGLGISDRDRIEVVRLG